MKNLLILSVLFVWLFAGCDKFEPLISSKDNEFPDFDFTSVYFPIQYPIRTVDLATDARLDNSVDLEHKFNIGISMGGVYENTLDREVRFEYDPSLLPDSMAVSTSAGEYLDSILILPSNYYELLPASGSFVTIPAGEYNGLIEVQLKDEFFADPLSITNSYVIPLRITEANNIDSILTGLPLVTDPVKTNSAHWEAGTLPHDYTLFMVKYINKFHGDYLLRGADYTLDGANNRVDTLVYRSKYLTENIVTKMRTTGLSNLKTNFIGNKVSDAGDYSLSLDIDGTGSVSISSIPDSVYQVSGTGSFLSREESTEVWGDEERKTFFLHYTYVDATVIHEVFDTLVFRNTGTLLEYYTPEEQ